MPWLPLTAFVVWPVSTPKRDDFRMNPHRALAPCFSMIFSENRYTLFRIML
jgi:hypothetical protein